MTSEVGKYENQSTRETISKLKYDSLSDVEILSILKIRNKIISKSINQTNYYEYRRHLKIIKIVFASCLITLLSTIFLIIYFISSNYINEFEYILAYIFTIVIAITCISLKHLFDVFCLLNPIKDTVDEANNFLWKSDMLIRKASSQMDSHNAY